MTTMIHDPVLEQRLREQRKAFGGDHHDEVWEGIYVMAPLPNNEHQRFVTRWVRILDEIITNNELGNVFPGVNVSDRVEDWGHNYRIPDVAIFLNTTRAVNHDTFWYGGPDLAIEIISRYDQSREKLKFYGAVGTQELLLIDRDPWQLEVYRLSGNEMKFVARLSSTDRAGVQLEVVPLIVHWVQPTSGRPQLQVTHLESGRTWTM